MINATALKARIEARIAAIDVSTNEQTTAHHMDTGMVLGMRLALAMVRDQELSEMATASLERSARMLEQFEEQELDAQAMDTDRDAQWQAGA